MIIFLFFHRYGQSLGGSLLVAKLAWPHEWVLIIGAFCSTVGAALQCLTSKYWQSTGSSAHIPAKMKNVRQRAPVKFNQMSGEEVQMSGEAKKNFVYTDSIATIYCVVLSVISQSFKRYCRRKPDSCPNLPTQPTLVLVHSYTTSHCSQAL